MNCEKTKNNYQHSTIRFCIFCNRLKESKFKLSRKLYRHSGRNVLLYKLVPSKSRCAKDLLLVLPLVVRLRLFLLGVESVAKRVMCKTNLILRVSKNNVNPGLNNVWDYLQYFLDQITVRQRNVEYVYH